MINLRAKMGDEFIVAASGKKKTTVLIYFQKQVLLTAGFLFFHTCKSNLLSGEQTSQPN